MLPFADIWTEYLQQEGLSDDYYDEIAVYEAQILKERK